MSYKFFNFRVLPNFPNYEFNNKLVQFKEPSLNYSEKGIWVKNIPPHSHFLTRIWTVIDQNQTKSALKFDISGTTLVNFPILITPFFYGYINDPNEPIINFDGSGVSEAQLDEINNELNFQNFKIHLPNGNTVNSYKYIETTNILEEYDAKNNLINTYMDTGINNMNINNNWNIILNIDSNNNNKKTIKIPILPYDGYAGYVDLTFSDKEVDINYNPVTNNLIINNFIYYRYSYSGGYTNYIPQISNTLSLYNKSNIINIMGVPTKNLSENNINNYKYWGFNIRIPKPSNISQLPVYVLNFSKLSFKSNIYLFHTSKKGFTGSWILKGNNRLTMTINEETGYLKIDQVSYPYQKFITNNGNYSIELNFNESFSCLYNSSNDSIIVYNLNSKFQYYNLPNDFFFIRTSDKYYKQLEDNVTKRYISIMSDNEENVITEINDITQFFSTFVNEQFINIKIIFQNPVLRITLLKSDNSEVELCNYTLTGVNLSVLEENGLSPSIKLLEGQYTSGNLLSNISWCDLYYN